MILFQIYVDTGRKKGYIPTSVIMDFPDEPVEEAGFTDTDSFSDPELIEFDSTPSNGDVEDLISLAEIHLPSNGQARNTEKEYVKAKFEFIGRSSEE